MSLSILLAFLLRRLEFLTLSLCSLLSLVGLGLRRRPLLLGGVSGTLVLKKSLALLRPLLLAPLLSDLVLKGKSLRPSSIAALTLPDMSSNFIKNCLLNLYKNITKKVLSPAPSVSSRHSGRSSPSDRSPSRPPSGSSSPSGSSVPSRNSFSSGSVYKYSFSRRRHRGHYKSLIKS